jgi:hypothetical protein
MARGPENTFIASIHRLLPKAIYALKNHNELNGGIADVWYDGPLGDLWVEYKFITVPKRDTTVIDLCGGKNPPLSKLQQQWLADRHRHGRKVAVVVGCKDGGVWYLPCEWTKPISAADFRALVASRQQIAQWISEYTCRG